MVFKSPSTNASWLRVSCWIYPITAKGYGPLLHFPLPNDEQVRDLLRSTFADFPPYRFPFRRHFRSHSPAPKPAHQSLAVVVEAIGHGIDLNLHRRQPGREGSAVMLQEEGHHALMVEKGLGESPRGCGARRPHPCTGGQGVQADKAELHRGDRLFPPRHRLKLDVDLGAVESCFPGAIKIVPTQLIKNLRSTRSAWAQASGSLMYFSLPFSSSGSQLLQAHPVISHPKYGVGLLVHLEDGLQFVFNGASVQQMWASFMHMPRTRTRPPTAPDSSQRYT